MNKKQIRNIKNNSERTLQGLKAKAGEFRFSQTDNYVPPDTIYSIYYTKNKKEIYITGVLSSVKGKIILKLGAQTNFSKYTKVKNIEREVYPKNEISRPTKSDYRAGKITRYFAQSANDKTKPPFEISSDSFGTQSALYKYTSLQWIISGTRDNVLIKNLSTIVKTEQEYPGIKDIISPLQFWKPSTNSVDDMENKLSRLKK